MLFIGNTLVAYLPFVKSAPTARSDFHDSGSLILICAFHQKRTKDHATEFTRQDFKQYVEREAERYSDRQARCLVDAACVRIQLACLFKGEKPAYTTGKTKLCVVVLFSALRAAITHVMIFLLSKTRAPPASQVRLLQHPPPRSSSFTHARNHCGVAPAVWPVGR